MANATTPKPVRVGEVSMSEQERRIAAEQRASTERRRQSLNLQSENILSQRTSNPGRRAALESALAEIESQLAALD